jgi:prepilin-type processing-associated H-X9-DG protein
MKTHRLACAVLAFLGLASWVWADVARGAVADVVALPGAQVASENNIKQIIQFMMLYANDNNGAYPDSLDDLLKYMQKAGANVDKIMTNPTRPDQKPGYVYVKPAQGDKTPADHVILYEKYDTFAPGINVGFVDGHIQRITSEAAFKKLLDAAQGSEKK